MGMGRLKTHLMSCALGALALTAMAAPVGGADTKGTLALVNGIPGTKVDVCINGNEIKSNLAYGGTVLKNVVGTGNKNLKFYERDPRTCRGHRVGRKTFVLDPGEDLTIVVTKKAPRVVSFDNKLPLFLGEIPPAGTPYVNSWFAWRHAAEVPANFRYKFWSPGPDNPVGPVADPIWTKGSKSFGATLPGIIVQLRARRAGALDTIAVKRAEMGTSHRYEWIFVGTKPANVRFVFIDRAASLASP
jgi:hypothetical protein